MAVIVVIALGIIFCVVFCTCHNDSENNEEEENKQKELISKEDEYFASAMSSDLTPITPPFSVKRGEVCYLSEDAVLLENRRVRSGTAFAGPTISIPIVKSLGLRFRAGYFAHAPVVSDELMPIDIGKMVVTNKSILFVGQKASKTISLQDVISTSIAQSPTSEIPFLVALTRRKGRILFFGTEHPSLLVAMMHRLTSTCGWLNSCDNESVAKIVAK